MLSLDLNFNMRQTRSASSSSHKHVVSLLNKVLAEGEGERRQPPPLRRRVKKKNKLKEKTKKSHMPSRKPNFIIIIIVFIFRLVHATRLHPRPLARTSHSLAQPHTSTALDRRELLARALGQQRLVLADALGPRLDDLVLAHPDALGDLVDEPEVVAHEHDAAVVLVDRVGQAVDRLDVLFLGFKIVLFVCLWCVCGKGGRRVSKRQKKKGQGGT